jgi:hypothetical protein
VLRSFSEAVVDKKNKKPKYIEWLQKAKLLAVIPLPLVLYNSVKDVSSSLEAIFKEKSADSAVEGGLMIAYDVSDLTGLIGSIIGGLQKFGFLTKGRIADSPAFFGHMGTLRSAVSIALNAKHGFEGFRLRRRLVQKFGAKANFEHVVDFIKGQKAKTLQKKLDIQDGGELKARLNAIWERNKLPGNESKKNIDKAMSVLKNRIRWMNIGCALKALAGTISLIAVAILLFTPFAPVSNAAFAAASALGIFILISGKRASKRFDSAIKNLAPDA